MLLVVIVGAYAWAARASAGRRPVTRRQATLFALGVVALWLGLGWPLHELGERYLFSAHMLQHMLVAYVAAPLLLLGTPGWMLRALLGRGRRLAVARQVVRPLPAFALFNAVLVLLHWPAAVDLMARSGPAHGLLHGVLLAASLVMWMPVVSPLPELPRLAPPASLFYLFAQSILPTVPASFLTFGEGVLYRFYETAPPLWGVSPVTDQQVAGLLMKVGGGFLLWGMIAVLFFTWQAGEEDRDRSAHRGDVDWDELELRVGEVGEVANP